MKFRVLCVGRAKNPHLIKLLEDYRTRIEHFLPIEVVEVKEPSSGDGDRRIEMEGEKLLAGLDPSDRVVLLDPNGRPWTSEQLAGFVQKHMSEDPRRLTFVIGGYGGLSDAVKKRANTVWSLSPLTFTHDMTRLLVLEQIYRALAIIHNLPYSK
jgi:23S rRNA (pseudouridine1915-N3)-methyltransferase